MIPLLQLWRCNVHFLYHNLDAENILDRYLSPIRHLDHASDCVDALDLAGDGPVAAAGLSLVRYEIGDGHRWPVRKQLLKVLQLRVDARDLALVELDALIRQPSRFRDGGVVTGEGGKGRKLRRAVMQRHAWMILRGRMREVDDTVLPMSRSMT